MRLTVRISPFGDRKYLIGTVDRASLLKGTTVQWQDAIFKNGSLL